MWLLKPRTRVSTLLLGLLTAPAFADEPRRLELSIVGTKVELDNVWLPARLEGMVFFRGGPRDGGIAGTYVETLRPLLDPELGLVGTIGESEFRFWKRNGRTIGADRVVTRNRSTIVGEMPRDGALLVESTGRVVDDRHDRGAGTLRSNAKVRLGSPFELDVNVTLVFGTPEESTRSTLADGADDDGTALVVTVTADGATEVRYGREFKRRVLRRLSGSDAPSPAAVSAETGLSEALLSRWSQQAGLLATLRRMQSALRPVERQRSFEEKLGVVLRAAAYSGEELDDVRLLEHVSIEDVAKWRRAIDTALESGGQASDAGNEARDEGDPADGAEALAELKKRVEALLENGPAEKEESPDEER